MSEVFSPELIYSKNKKYRIFRYSTAVYEGKNYHSFVVQKAIRNYWQQVDQGVNFSDNALQEYLDEVV